VFNAACTAKPTLIVVPKSEKDISHILRTAAKYQVEISVRSGGHSYTCNSLKEGSVHIVLEEFNEIEFVEDPEIETGRAAWLGTGARWGDILRAIDPKQYSYPHGQCKSVGVGGFLLGGGVNWLGTYNKYGYGAENVVKMKAVLANGDIVMVDKDYVYYEDRKVPHTEENNLFFGLRGAGSSLAIVTRFYYIIHTEPETRPAIVLIWLDNEEAVERMMKVISNTKKYSFMVNHQISSMDFWKRPLLFPMMQVFPLVMQLLKQANRKSTFPVQVMVTDMSLGAGKTTDAKAAIEYLRANGVDNLVDSYWNAMILSKLTPMEQASVYYTFDKFANRFYEEIELEQESWKPGVWSSISLNYGSLDSTTDFAQDFLHDPYVGIKRNLFLKPTKKGCEFCFWMIHFRNRQGQPDISLDNPISIRTDTNQDNSVEINLTCMFYPEQTKCPSVVNDIRARIDERLSGKDYSKYYNFPSCSKEGTDWKNLYWGSNTARLLQIKKIWDSEDMFNHCQSLTNNNITCCPFSS